MRTRTLSSLKLDERPVAGAFGRRRRRGRSLVWMARTSTERRLIVSQASLPFDVNWLAKELRQDNYKFTMLELLDRLGTLLPDDFAAALAAAEYHMIIRNLTGE